MGKSVPKLDHCFFKCEKGFILLQDFIIKQSQSRQYITLHNITMNATARAGSRHPKSSADAGSPATRPKDKLLYIELYSPHPKSLEAKIFNLQGTAQVRPSLANARHKNNNT